MTTDSADPALLVGLEAPDDAAVYRVTEDIALVQTVDFFTPIVDDPFDWGQIAAANALSDVYAMGGTPKTALNLVGWPRSLDFALLGRVLDGSSEICARAGVSVIGGHSVDDPEPKFGLSVTGLVHPERVIRKSGAQPGDRLVLTKPIGTGVISNALKHGRASDDAMAAAVESMRTLNAGAARALGDVRPHAATDVTGFGLIGHLREMLGTGLDATLEAGAIPFFPGAPELAGEGLVPGGSKRNAEAGTGHVDLSDELDIATRALVFDAQTSGGLLIAIAPDLTDDFLEALSDNEVATRAVIGEVSKGTGRVKVVA